MSKKNLPLTFEMTRGTKTYYLPAGKGVPPILTLMLRRRESTDGLGYMYSAGMAICSAGDRFERKVGRATAFERLRWARFRGLEFGIPLALLKPLMEQVRAAVEASPIYLPLFDTEDELRGILEKAIQTFDQMDENRASQVARLDVSQSDLNLDEIVARHTIFSVDSRKE